RLVQGASLAGVLALATLAASPGAERARARRLARGPRAAGVAQVQGGSHLMFDALAVGLRAAAGAVPGSPCPDPAVAATRALALGSAALTLSALRHEAAADAARARGTKAAGRAADAAGARAASGAQRPAGRPALRACGYAAFALSMPYPVVKLAWECGSDVGITRPEVIHAIPGGWLPVVPALAGSALSLALVRPWGRVVPRWVPGIGGAGVPRWLVLGPAGLGVAVLAQVAPAAFTAGIRYHRDPTKPPIEEIGLRSWVPLTFYTCWLLWGGALAGAAWEYHRATAPALAGPAPGASR
uniref:hypothetical protein n=1 Tax=Streptomyces sp. SBT349 TaxID=1580539 RepID=UPI00066EA1F0